MPLSRRLAAWLITGPVGHFTAGMTDWIVMLSRYWWARAKGNDPRDPSP